MLLKTSEASWLELVDPLLGASASIGAFSHAAVFGWVWLVMLAQSHALRCRATAL